TLAPAEKDALDRHGYVVLPDVLDEQELAQIRAAFDTAIEQGRRHGAHVHLAWDDPAFDDVYTRPKVLAAVYHVLGRAFRMSPVIGRAPVPGVGQQSLHQDWGRTASEPYQVVTTLWMVDDFTPTNGATRVIPGSHRIPRALPKSMQQPDCRHPDQKVII